MFADDAGMTGEAFRRFKTIIRAVDAEYLRIKAHAAEMARKTPPEDDDDDQSDAARAKATKLMARKKKAAGAS